MPSTFTVNTVADDPGGPTAGQVTLRDAINSVNSDPNPGTDTINFAITSPATGPWIIQPTQALPVITHSVLIDGTTQIGWSPGNPVIELDGSQTAGANGLEVNADNATIQGLHITGWANGIQIDAVSGTTVQDNVIGIDPRIYGGTPPPPLPPAGNAGDGVAVSSGATNTLIGGTTSAEGNVIASNMTGIIASAPVAVEGNLIVANGAGLVVAAGGSGSLIGGSVPNAGNSIYENLGNGVTVSSANRVAILGNSIFSNGTGGIVLENGANNALNAPSLTSASSTTPPGVSWTTVTVSGVLAGSANTTYRVEFFASIFYPFAPVNENGEVFLGAQDVTTYHGLANFTVNLSVPPSLDHPPPPGSGGYCITATATDPNNNTSAFSWLVPVQFPPPPPPAPVGPLTVFAFGFGPGFGLDQFSVDNRGLVFAQAIDMSGVGSPVFFSPALSLQMWGMSNGQVLGLMPGTDGQSYSIAIFANFFNTYVETALLDALMAQLGFLI